ncbi:MAG: MATE family efflux transporter [Thermodesulfovibrionales bacterium]
MSALTDEIVHGSPWRPIWKSSWPMLIIMILNFCVGLIDVYVAGLIGPRVQAAVGFSGQVLFLVIIVANAISVGTVAIVSRAAGAGDASAGIAAARQSLVFGIVVAAGLTLCVAACAGPVSTLLGAPGDVKEIAEQFLRIFSFALGPNYFLIISNAVFRASGDMRSPLISMTLVSAVNIAANFVLVFGAGPVPALGYPGIALAAAASFVCGAVLNLVLLAAGRWRPLFRRPFSISARTIRAIARIGWPAGLLQIAWSAGTLVLYAVLARLGETEGIAAAAAFTNGLRIEAVIYLPAFALNMAASVIVGQNLGAGRQGRAEQLGWRITLAGTVFVGVMAVATFLAADRLAAGLSADSEVIAGTARYLRYNMISEPFMAMSAILGGALQGAGDTRGTMAVIITSMWLVRLPLAFLLAIAGGLGATGVWAAMVASMCLQGMLMAWRFRRGRWKHLQVLS